jgi:signal transduction histidine kinase
MLKAFASRLGPVSVPAAALAYATAAIVLISRGAAPLRTYAGASISARALDLAAGLALLVGGSLAWSQARLQRVALLAIVAGALWFAPDWEGLESGPTIVRSLGVVAAPFFLAAVVHLTLAFPSGRLRGRLSRPVVLSVYAVAAVVGIGWAMFRDPFADPGCWRYCGANVFLVSDDPGVAFALRDVWLRAALAIGLLVAALVGLRLARAQAHERRRLLPVLAPAALVGLAEAAYAGALLHTRLEDPQQEQFMSIFDARSLATTAVAVGLGWAVAQAWRTRATVSRLAQELRAAPRPGALAERLAAALGDAGLEVAYWLPGLRRYVDGRGQRVDPPTSSNGRAATPIVRGGDPVAVVVHDAALLDGERLEDEIGAAARLALDNERLHAEVVARLEDVRESRVRIVEAADAERRRLERDLHDGAQQRLLALSYDLRLAAAAARAGADIDAAYLLTSAVDETQVALDELRDLARGIYPAILTEAGLGPALATLADVAPIAVTLAELPGERFETSVETTAYVTVVDAIDAAVGRKASFVDVQLNRAGDLLVVIVEDDGQPRKGGISHLEDRVGALGGRLELGTRTLRAEIPCA